MRSLKYLGSFVAVALILCLGALAKDANSGSFELTQPAQVGSTVLQPGEYKAEWTGSPTDVTINILQHGKTVATTKGSIKELPAKAANDSVTLKNVNNQQQVHEIDFHHRAEALMFSGM